MRFHALWAGAAASAALFSFAHAQTAAPALPAAAERTTPTEVALTEEAGKGFIYRQFPSSLRLYVSAHDPVGASTCYEGCSMKWIPVAAPLNSPPTGEWTVVLRRDGVRQWALRGKPVYMRVHDSPDAPAGDGDEGGVWRLLQFTPQATAAN